MHSGATPYRADIDGLRAVAIVSVVAFHAWPQHFPGGFFGVDVFFVISGFLISRIVLSPGFAFGEFYRRRVRRLFPALIAVVVVTLIVGRFLLATEDFRNLLKYAIGGGLFAGNVVAYGDTGYFGGAPELKPLLHLWSLGVEEQFYLSAPVFFLLAFRSSRPKRWIAVFAAASFAAFVWVGMNNAMAAFYLSPLRFWEFLAGAAIGRVSIPHRWAKVASPLGMTSIAASVALSSAEIDIPVLAFLLPVCGAALVIASPSSRVNQTLLSSRTAVWVGLISYPLYLWHWPILAFMRQVERVPSALAWATALLVMLGLSDLTYRTLERRTQRMRLGRTATVLAGTLGVVIIASIVTLVRLPSSDRVMTTEACQRRYPYDTPSLWFCALSKDAEPEVLLLGDSHANHLYPGLASALPGKAVLSLGACMPTVGVVYTAKVGSSCAGQESARALNLIESKVLSATSLKWVVVSALWPAFDEAGNEIDAYTGKPTHTFDVTHATALETYTRGLAAMLDSLGDRQITIVLDTPRRGFALDDQRTRQVPWRQSVAALSARRPNVTVIDPLPLLCYGAMCRWDLFSDQNHLSAEGSRVVAEALVKSRLVER